MYLREIASALFAVPEPELSLPVAVEPELLLLPDELFPPDDEVPEVPPSVVVVVVLVDPVLPDVPVLPEVPELLWSVPSVEPVPELLPFAAVPFDVLLPLPLPPFVPAMA